MTKRKRSRTPRQVPAQHVVDQIAAALRDFGPEITSTELGKHVGIHRAEPCGELGNGCRGGEELFRSNTRIEHFGHLDIWWSPPPTTGATLTPYLDHMLDVGQVTRVKHENGRWLWTLTV